MTFGVWLKKQSVKDPALQAVQQFAANRGGGWPYESDVLSDYMEVVFNHAAAADQQKLLLDLSGAHDRWVKDSAPKTKGIIGLILDNIGAVLLALFGLIIASMLAAGIFSDDFLDSLAKPEQARGLITFLFAFSTIAILLLVAISTFWMDKGEVEERFQHAKDLITIMIGVLGTILGFYFGSISNDNVTNRGLYVANVITSNQNVAPGETLEISGAILGGANPYRYDIEFSDPTGKVPTQGLLIHNKESVDGAIREKVQVPGTATPPAAVIYTVTARDTNGTLARSSGTFFIQAVKK